MTVQLDSTPKIDQFEENVQPSGNVTNNSSGPLTKPNDQPEEVAEDSAKSPIERPQERNQKLDKPGSDLRYGAGDLVRLLVPITICVVFVVLTIKLFPDFVVSKEKLPYTPMSEDVDSNVTKILHVFINVAVYMAVVILTTMLLICLFYYRIYWAIVGLLYMSTILTLSFICLLYVYDIFRSINFPIDYVTIGVLIYNNAVLGCVAIYSSAPMKLNQFYLILVAGLTALILIKFLPDWTTWAILFAMILWDLFAVLCPHGPLRCLVETAKTRDEPLPPGLIYSSIIYVITCAKSDKTSSAKKRKAIEKREDEEPARPKLGLGDFVFYSILIGKVALSGDWFATLACYLTVIVGLGTTLIILALTQNALPALPISIMMALTVHVFVYFFVTPFGERLQSTLTYI